jgi:effector-binding domain-containing protein
VTITVRYQSKDARDTASRSGMERGMIAGFDRLEELLLADEAPRVVETPPRVAAALHLVIPRSEIRSAMGPGLNEVMAAIKAQGAEPAGPWFTHHRKMDPSMVDFEICVPVTAPMPPHGRVTLLDIPATTAARMIDRGSYEGLSGAWGRLMAWIETEGHTPAPDLFECYVAGPETGIDASQWRTELVRPLIR